MNSKMVVGFACSYRSSLSTAENNDSGIESLYIPGIKKPLLTEARRSGLLRLKNLFILGALEGSNDFSFSGFCVFPTFNFYPLAFFEVFVVLEEVSDLSFQQFRQIVYVFNVIVFVAQLSVRNSNQFRIFTGFVGHFQNANRTAADHRTRLQRVRSWDQYVNRVTVQRQGVVDVTVVAR